MDWAPTLIGMAGGNTKDLYRIDDNPIDTKDKATYGNSMWEYIKNSVEPGSKKREDVQKFRQVAISSTLFYDIQKTKTMKYWSTTGANLFIRKWNPIYPTGDEVVSRTNVRLRMNAFNNIVFFPFPLTN